LWELAYTELYFTPAWWPDFGREALEAALQDFAGRERRYGLTSQQVVYSNQFAFRQGGK
ncbi:MAG TPA: undecaprenyl diphosphate synthase family protein, partial [Gammaproteobacteria bacterium]|nr:undecaprenyl diphosphate synthase family protein [Gammaproteobacteria bacterium]